MHRFTIMFLKRFTKITPQNLHYLWMLTRPLPSLTTIITPRSHCPNGLPFSKITAKKVKFHEFTLQNEGQGH